MNLRQVEDDVDRGSMATSRVLVPLSRSRDDMAQGSFPIPQVVESLDKNFTSTDLVQETMERSEEDPSQREGDTSKSHEYLSRFLENM
jgi:hypothetical protein